MNNIEEILKTVAQNDFEIPAKIEHRINYTLKNKNKNNKKSYIQKIITITVSILFTMLGSISVYATLGGTINGVPIIEWLGINFSKNYNEYKEEITGKELNYKETSIDLLSVVPGDGFAIFEFDIKLSDADKEYLKLGENVISDQEWEKNVEQARQKYEKGLNGISKQQGIPFEQTAIYKELEQEKNLINTVDLVFDNYSKQKNIFIDDEGYYVKTIQNRNKITENEYKVYELYLLTDEILNGKEDFKVTFKNIILGNIADYKVTEEQKMYLTNTQNNKRNINIDGEITINVSKKKIAENSKIIDNIEQEIKYKKLTEKIEKVTITPIQTVIKISRTYNNISLMDLSVTTSENHISKEEYLVKDELGNEIPNINFETKRKITYSNGKTEEWATGDIGTYKNFTGAKMETINYLIIENKENINKLNIIAQSENYIRNNDGITTNWEKIGEYNIEIDK